ncbi:MAG: hypothetical protein RL033_2640 [Pseudomonadota bacterium]
MWHSVQAKPSASSSGPKPFYWWALLRILGERVFGGLVPSGRVSAGGVFAARRVTSGRVTAWYAGARRRAATRRTAPLRTAGLGCLSLAHGTPHQATRHATVSFRGNRGREKSVFGLRASATCSGAAARDEINCLSPSPEREGPLALCSSRRSVVECCTSQPRDETAFSSNQCFHSASTGQRLRVSSTSVFRISLEAGFARAICSSPSSAISPKKSQEKVR